MLNFDIYLLKMHAYAIVQAQSPITSGNSPPSSGLNQVDRPIRAERHITSQFTRAFVANDNV